LIAATTGAGIASNRATIRVIPRTISWRCPRAIARKRACIDTCGENLPASSQNNAIFATFTRDSRKCLLERQDCVEIERIDRGPIDRNNNCFVNR